MRSLERRIVALERRVIGGEIVCYMADGTEHPIRGKRLVDMLREISQGIVRPDTRAVLDAVGDNCLENGYGYLGNLLRVMWAGAQDPVKLTPEEVATLDVSESQRPGIVRHLGRW